MKDDDNTKLIYGIHTCNAQIKINPEAIRKIYVKKPPYNQHIKNLISLINIKKVNLIEVEKDFLSTITLSSKHQGIALEIKESSQSGFDLDLYLQTEKLPFIVIFDSIQDPRNLGSCIRTANAAGVNLIVKRKSNSCEISPLVHKTASGGLQGLALYETNNLISIVKKLKNSNIKVIGTADDAKNDIYDFPAPPSGVAIILGSEGEGMSNSLLSLCDDICRIPIYGTVECLNVAVATGIALYQLKNIIKKIK